MRLCNCNRPYSWMLNMWNEACFCIDQQQSSGWSWSYDVCCVYDTWHDIRVCSGIFGALLRISKLHIFRSRFGVLHLSRTERVELEHLRHPRAPVHCSNRARARHNTYLPLSVFASLSMYDVSWLTTVARICCAPFLRHKPVHFQWLSWFINWWW